MKKAAGVIVSLGVLALVGATFLGWDTAEPGVILPEVNAVGPASRLNIQVEDRGKGLRRVQVSLAQEGRELELALHTEPAPLYPWVSGTRQFAVEIEEFGRKELKDGPFELRVTASDHGNLWLLRRTTTLSRTYRYDSVPPRIEVLSGQHYLRQGGSETILYRVSEAGSASGVQVGENRFLGSPLAGGAGLHLAIFALEYDQPVDAPMTVWAEDEAGNRSQARFWNRVTTQSFRKRDLQITDNFIQAVASEILSHSEMQPGATPLETFLLINRELRVRDNRKIAELTRAVTAETLWTEPFLQLSNSKVEAVFADRRSYFYQGAKCDEQTHLGFDLASLAQSPAEASNRGRVVYADYLGIYGNTVILDHGRGLYSLYAHLSSFAVETGQIVDRGQSVGSTGQTGLAGGDHLHYSMLVQGIQVNPVEWWDPAWLRIRMLDRLNTASLNSLQ